MNKIIITLTLCFVSCSSILTSQNMEVKAGELPNMVQIGYFDNSVLVGYNSELLSAKKDFDYYVKSIGLNKKIKNYEEKMKNLYFTFAPELLIQSNLNPNMFSGYCFNPELLKSSNNDGVIFINKFMYSTMDTKARKKLVYHEMSHCILGSIHDNRESEKSIMNQTQMFSYDRPEIEYFQEIKSSKNINLINKVIAYNDKMRGNPKYIKRNFINYLYHTEEFTYFDEQTFSNDINDYNIKILNNLKKGN